MSNNKKYAVFVLFVLSSSVIGYHLQSIAPRFQEKQHLNKTLSEVASQNAKVDDVVILNADISDWAYPKDEIIDWEQSQFGYFLSNVKASDYDSYSTQTLSEMGKLGDLRALDVLALRELSNKNRAASIDAYNQASILGSTYALIQLGRLVPKSYIEGEMLEDRMKRITEIQLAYYQAAILRGDTSVLSKAKAFLEVRNIELSLSSKSFIQETGLKIYNNLISRRKELGLSSFQEMPKTVKDFYSYVARGNSGLTKNELPVFLLSIDDD